jgi:F-type H+-transporting ATPase subunit delta
MTTTIARPYVAAAFEFASAKNDLPAWENMLQSAAQLVENKELKSLLQNPSISSYQIADLLAELLAPLDAGKSNFIQLLAENDRLSVLPEIALLFKAARKEKEKSVTAHVSSAVALSKDYQEKLIKALTKRLQRKVDLQCEVTPDLLGGVIVRAGDLVIDGSVSGKLTRLNDFI